MFNQQSISQRFISGGDCYYSSDAQEKVAPKYPENTNEVESVFSSRENAKTALLKEKDLINLSLKKKGKYIIMRYNLYFFLFQIK